MDEKEINEEIVDEVEDNDDILSELEEMEGNTETIEEEPTEQKSNKEEKEKSELFDYFGSYVESLQKYHGDHKKAIFEHCFQYNIPFCEEIYELLTKTKSDSVFENMPVIYDDTIAADIRFKDITFFDQLQMENFEQVYSETLPTLGLNEESRKDREQIIKIIGYDPFSKNPIEDKPQLYRDLTGMLTDNMRKDIPRAKAAVEVVTGYNNIRKYQDRVNQLINNGNLDDDTQKQLDKHLEMIAKITASVNALCEKNGFVNSKAIGNNGKGMLSDVMNTIDEHTYDPGIVDYYDIQTSQSIRQISDISIKSMLNQVKLTGQDYVEMLSEQNKIVHEAQEKMRALKEALRIAKSLIVKDKLLEELAIEYRKKGISEEDIDEFINREYKLSDGR